ncbi:MAG: vanadium-dependent haloperoxidase [Pseudobdellovibrionaceae bacterium]|nr:vanadium-dependent haloperoxidase [Pseudobdellovibrionaceae bacterium]
MRTFIPCLAVLFLAAPSFAHTMKSNDKEFVAAWNMLALDSIRREKIAPPIAAQYLAAMHLAMFEAANRSSGTYISQLNIAKDSSFETLQRLHAAAAAHRVLQEFAPQEIQQKAETMLHDESLMSAGSEELKQLAKVEARRLGETIIAQHLTDPGTTPPASIIPTGPGYWIPTPPAFASYLIPGWGQLRPWVLDQANALRPLGPPALDSTAYAASWDEVKRLGSKTSIERTETQTETALFWADGAGTSTPPGHWNTILTHHLASCDNALVDIARVYAVLNMAMADACISAWESKWDFYFWRPITAIREAARDGNPVTQPDPAWEPLLNTPPFPAYVSGHAAVSGAAADILKDFFVDRLPVIRVGSESIPTTREYSDFPSVAQEAANSRVYGGIHFNFDGVDGLLLGRSVGQTYQAIALRPQPGSKAAAAGRVCR